MKTYASFFQASTNDCANLCKELQSRIEIIERQQTSSNPASPVSFERLSIELRPISTSS